MSNFQLFITNRNIMKRTKDQLEDLLLEAIEQKQIFTIRKLRKELAELKEKESKKNASRVIR